MTSLENHAPAQDVDTLDGFDAGADLRLFFDHMPETAAAFDILSVPTALWEHLYLVDCDPRGALSVKLTGQAIRDVFGRDITGLDLRRSLHGGYKGRVTRAFDEAIAEQRKMAMRQVVFFQQEFLARVVECGFCPMSVDGRVVELVGCMYFHEYHGDLAHVGRSELYRH